MGDLEQILKLIDAGYSKTEIAELLKKPDEMQKDEPEKKNKPQEQPEKKDKPQEQPELTKIDEAISKLEKLGDNMAKLGDNMAKLAIMTSEQPAKQELNDYLASIIDPTYKKGE